MKLDRRSMFRALIGAPVVVAVSAAPAAVVAPPVIGRTGQARTIRLALIRLGVLRIGEDPDLTTALFCSDYLEPGMDDADLAIAVQPYFPVSPAPPEVYAHTPPQVCIVCGSMTWTILPRYILSPQEVMQCCHPECANHWPWLQDGVKQTRVSAEARRLFQLVDQKTESRRETIDWFPNIPGGLPSEAYPLKRAEREAAIQEIQDRFERERHDLYELIVSELKNV